MAARQPVDRAARATTLPVEWADASHLRVTGSSSVYMLAVLEDGSIETCPCPDAQIRGAVCAHTIAGRLFLERETDGGEPFAETGAAGPSPERDITLPPEPDDNGRPDPQQRLIDRLSEDELLDVRDHERVEPHAARPPGEPPVGDERCSDMGNARRFVRLHGASVRYVKSQRSFFIWDERRWLEDVTGAADRFAKAVLEAIYREASVATDEARRKALAQHAVRSDSALKIRSMLELASTEPELVLRAEQLDAGPMLLNVRNGTLDLETGTLREHRRSDYMTRLAPVLWNRDAKAPRWERFLSEIAGADDELVAYLQRSIGYSLTGDTREQCLFFCHGQGANGKTVFLETVQAMLGPDYARTTAFETVLDGKRQAGSASPDLARLRGVRLVSASEAPGGQPLDDTVLKQLTGGDTITARRLYQEAFEFRPTFKLWLRANHRPPVREQTIAFWRRMRLIPFTVTIPSERQDRELAAKLRYELPGILAWAVRGCLAWLKEGRLPEPKVVAQATAAYRTENDTLGEFLDARCAMDPHAWTSSADLYTAFVSWWKETHGEDRPLSRNWFGRALGERSDVVASERGHTKARGWAGVRLSGVLPGATVAEGEARDELPF